MSITRASSDGVRERHRRLVLEQISLHRQVARQEIVQNTGLSKPVVSSIVTELIEQGLVHEIGTRSSTIGRPRVLLAFTPDARWMLGAELNDHECRVVLTNLYAETMALATRPIPTQDVTRNAQRMLRNLPSPISLVNVLEECITEVTAGLAVEKILGLGVCVPGVVDPVSGTVVTSVILPWHNVALAALLRERFDYPVVVLSRGSAATWGERWYGAGRTVDNLLYTRVGHGVVAGLVLNGQPYWGHNFAAGELGHITVQPDGELCHCGSRGCLATVATVDALIARVRQLLRKDIDNPLWELLEHDIERLTLSELIAAADRRNSIAERGFAELAKWLAIAATSAIHLLDLQMVIIGGPIAQAGDHLFSPLRQELAERLIPTYFRRVQVVPSALAENAPAIGAASLVLHGFISASRTVPLIAR